jgi:septal ring factor EnvC (AmiA/AmiB activator)
MADSNSKIAWHRVQLKKNRAALKRLEIARFTTGQDRIDDRIGETQKMIDDISGKIAESEKCISAYEQQTRRPLGTDFRSLTNVSWGNWNAHTNER